MTEQKSKVLFIFPGQGSQYCGIGSDLYAQFASVRQVYQEAEQTLQQDIAELSFHDPEGVIHFTRYTQLALLTHQRACLAAYRELAGERALRPSLLAGHSLGEYSALVEAGVLTFDAALRLVARRGELMGATGAGRGMLALTLDAASARSLAERHYCGVAGLNLPDQTVVGGAEGDLDALAAEMAERYPKKRAIRLQTQGAFHTYYMIEAAQHYRAALAEAEFSAPRVEVLSNYSGGLHEADPETIRAYLFLQLFHPVNWLGCIQSALDAGVSHIIEFGGGIGSGESPAEKRPNLEGIIKKLVRGRESPPSYQAVINVETLRGAVLGSRF